MAIPEGLCMGCMRNKGDGDVCQYCGSGDSPQLPPLLPLRTLLQERYLVGKRTSVTGEGIVYMGWDTVLNAPVEIHEFFPATMVGRGGSDATVLVHNGYEEQYAQLKNTFIEYSRVIARIRDIPAIIPTYDIFETNATAYSISESVEGEVLETYLQRRGGRISWESARQLIMPVLSGVIAMHSAGALHLGIYPRSILVDKRGRARLTSYSIPEARRAGTLLKAQFFTGYTSFEQYMPDGDVGVRSDVYGMSATLLTMLSGTVPTEATQRVDSEKLLIPSFIVGSIPRNVSLAIAKGMKIKPGERTASITDLRDELSVSPSITGMLSELERTTSTVPAYTKTIQATLKKEEKPVEPPPKIRNKSKINYGLAISTLLLFVAVIILMVLYLGKGNNIVLPPGPSSSAPPVSQSESSATSLDSILNYPAPNAIGQTYETLQKSNQWPYVEIVLAGQVFDDSVAVGTVVKQEPAVGTPIAEGTQLKVYVSRGPYTRALRDFHGVTLLNTVQELAAQGFECVPVEKNDPSVPNGVVISTSPAAGEEADFGSKVLIYVSNYVEEPPSSSSPTSSSS